MLTMNLLMLPACGMAGSFDPTAQVAKTTGSNPPAPHASGLLEYMGTTFLLVVGALCLAFVARLLNHRRKDTAHVSPTRRRSHSPA